MQCNATYRALDAWGIEYQVIDVTEVPEALEQVKALGYLQAPVVITDEDHWSGFRGDKIDELANRLGIRQKRPAIDEGRLGGDVKLLDELELARKDAGKAIEKVRRLERQLGVVPQQLEPTMTLPAGEPDEYPCPPPGR